MLVRAGRSIVCGLVLAVALSACVGGAPPATPAVSANDAPTSAKPTPTPEAPSDAEAVIVVASVDVDGLSVTVSGYVAGVIEDGGECSYVFESEPGEHVVASNGTADRASTSCGAVSVPVADLGRGTWSVRLEYKSDDVEVVSEAATVEVP